MKKYIVQLVSACALVVTLQSCEAQKVVVNREVETTNDGKMLLGAQSKDQLLKEPYAKWYHENYDAYQIDAATLSELKKENLGSYTITVFLGTWCEDSHNYVPKLMKILEEVKHPEQKLHIIAVNRKKESPNGEEGVYNIQYVPTIILSKYGKEVGRFIEYSKTGLLEKDLLQLIKDKK